MVSMTPQINTQWPKISRGDLYIKFIDRGLDQIRSGLWIWLANQHRKEKTWPRKNK